MREMLPALVAVLFYLLPAEVEALSLPLTRASFHFDFHNVPYTAGIYHVHSPEAMTQRTLFRVGEVEPVHVMGNR